MPELQIVKLAVEEWRRYKQIRLEALLVEPQAFASSYPETLQRPNAHWQARLKEAEAGEKGWLLFAKQDGRIMGMIGSYRAEARDEVEIISVYVAKESRRQGAARALMAAILEEVRKGHGFRKARLTVNADQTAAVALYRSFGFQIVGEKAGIMGDGNSYQGYSMEKEMSDAA